MSHRPDGPLSHRPDAPLGRLARWANRLRVGRMRLELRLGLRRELDGQRGVRAIGVVLDGLLITISAVVAG